jgi:hypothetical protein
MRARALLAPYAVALVACLDASPDPAPATARTPAAWPTVPAYDLDADVKLRSAFAHTHLVDGMDVLVQDGVFVLAAPVELGLLDDAAPRTHEALAALLHGRFSRLPSRAVTVYVLSHPASFGRLCRERLGPACSPTWLGVWIKETREIIVDQSQGPTSLVHELVHPLLENEAPTLPRWLREGISALFEHPEIHGLEIHGTTNWRVADLRRALASPTERELVHLDGQDRLWRFYQAWRDHADADPSGEKAFAGGVHEERLHDVPRGARHGEAVRSGGREPSGRAAREKRGGAAAAGIGGAGAVEGAGCEAGAAAVVPVWVTNGV